MSNLYAKKERLEKYWRGPQWERSLYLVQAEREEKLKGALGKGDSLVYDGEGRPFCAVCGRLTTKNWEHFDEHTKTVLGFMEALHIIWLRKNRT